MRRVDAEVRALRPAVVTPDDGVRAAAQARLAAVIEAEPDDGLLGCTVGRRRRALTPGPLLPAFTIAVAAAVALVVVTLLGHRAPAGTTAAGRPAAGSILAAGGRPLSAVSPALARAVRAEHRSQLAAGDALRSSIDPALQRVAVRALSRVTSPHDAATATVVAMNPDTGAVEALTSAHEAVGVARQPGSVFDSFTALVALQTGSWIPGETYDDTGKLCVGAHRVCLHNVEHVVYGQVDVRDALAAEDRLFFEHLGLLSDARPQNAPLLSGLGLGDRTGIDLPGEVAGRLSTPSTPPLVAFRAVGLGSLALTPIQLAVAESALANGGDVVVPRVVGSVIGRNGAVFSTRVAGTGLDLRIATLSTIRAGLRANAAGAGVVGATEATFGGFPYAVHGLAGSVLDLPATLQDGRAPVNALYAGWVPAHAGHPPLVVVVSIPGGGFGATVAAPVARQVFSQWETGRPGPWRPGDSRVQ